MTNDAVTGSRVPIGNAGIVTLALVELTMEAFNERLCGHAQTFRFYLTSQTKTV